MADKKISALTSATTPLAGTEVLPIVQSGATVKVSAADITAGRAMSALSGSFGTATSAYSVTGTQVSLTNTSANTYLSVYGGSGNTNGGFLLGGNNAENQANFFWNQTSNYLQVAANPVSSKIKLIAAGVDVGDITTNGYTPTAAKGVNFTANTGAAGMTSQLLNWYEEGTWTPTRNGFTEVLGAGSITTSGTYTRVGRMVTVIASIVPAGGATIAATSGIGSYLSGLPFSVATPCPGAWVDSSSVADNGGILANVTELYVTTAWVASGNVKRISATYFV